MRTKEHVLCNILQHVPKLSAGGDGSHGDRIAATEG